MEQTNTSAVNELRTAITSLREVIGALGNNAATQAEALKGIKEVFTNDMGNLRSEQQSIATELERDRQKLVDFNNHANTKEELAQAKLDTKLGEMVNKIDSRFKEAEGRITTLETTATRSNGYWDGARYVLYFALLGGGGLGMYVLEHIGPALLSLAAKQPTGM